MFFHSGTRATKKRARKMLDQTKKTKQYSPIWISYTLYCINNVEDASVLQCSIQCLHIVTKDFSRPHRARLGSRRHLCYIFLHISKIYYRSFRGSGGVRNVTGRVGSRRFKISRFGSSRVKRFSNLSGRVGSGQEVFENYGSGRVGWSQKVFKSHESDRVGK